MPSIKPRRSARLSTNDSNGREYLADTVGWTPEKLEAWITSPTVRPHLQLWHRLCIDGRRRFNHAVDWINSEPKGYFYNENDLQDDLLLICLCEGDRIDSGYMTPESVTGKWTTQELWARTAWRIVNDNKDPGQAFAGTTEERPSACYGFAIDLLCISFHSIAFRGKASCYELLINGADDAQAHLIAQRDLAGDANDDASDSITSVSSLASSTETSDHSSDLDFVQPRNRGSGARQAIKPITENEDDSTRNVRMVQEWVAEQRTQSCRGMTDQDETSDAAEAYRSKCQLQCNAAYREQEALQISREVDAGMKEAKLLACDASRLHSASDYRFVLTRRDN